MSKRWPHKILIGLTGNIATGKSAVMRMARARGALTLDADQIVHELQDSDAVLQEAIVEEFGPQVIKHGGRVDRSVLGSIVFNDPMALETLEQLVHPPARQTLFDRIEGSEAEIVFVEAIKLLEGGWADECDEIWVTRCPAATQMERLRVCRGLDKKTAALRVKAQPPQEEKIAAGDVVIDTSGTLADTQEFFDLLWSRLTHDFVPTAELPPLFEETPPLTVEEPETEDLPVKTTSAIPPKRLDAAGAAELRAKLKANSKAGEEQNIDTDHAILDEPTIDDATVRRARPSDVPSILLLIQRATAGQVKMKRAELLMELGERGYLIGQVGAEISAVAGWSTEDQVARIDRIYISPLKAASVTGAAVLKEIEHTANQLICEVIFAYVTKDAPDEIRNLYSDRGFEAVIWETLPKAWRSAAAESQPESSLLMMKKLRETRIV